MARINRDNLSHHLIEYQFSLIGKTMEEAIKNKNWLQEWSISSEKEEEFKIYAITLIKKVLKCNKSKAENAYNWLSLGYGLRVK